MIKEIGPGIYQIRMRLPWSVDFMPFSPASVNAYVVVRGGRLMLVDSGLNNASCQQTLRADLVRLGLDVSSITDLVITHFHADHIGLIDRLRRASPKAVVHVHPADRALIRKRYFRPVQAMAELMSWLTSHGLPADEDADVAAVRLDSGDFTACGNFAGWGPNRARTLELDGQAWQLIWTPGHTPGHLAVFCQDERVLLAGDQLLASTTSNVSKHPGSGDDPLRDYRASLALLSGLAVEQIWTGHGEAVSDPRGRAQRVVRQQDRKLAHLLDRIDGRPVTAHELALQLWGRGRPELDANSRRLALTETMAFLAYLESSGAIAGRADVAGQISYSRCDG